MSQDVETRALRSALEYAVLIAEETQKRKPTLAVPNELRRFFGGRRIPTGALGRVRRAVEADDVFRTRIAAAASPELVDRVGLLWLQRPPDWQAAITAELDDTDRRAAEADAAAALRKSERRRLAAEEAAARARAETIRLAAIVESQAAQLDDQAADLVKANEAVAELRAELVDSRNEARHARDRHAAALAKLERAAAATVETEPAPPPSPGVSDADLLAVRDRAQAAAAAAGGVVSAIDSIVRGPAPTVASEPTAPRRALRIEGGASSTSAKAAASLLRSGAAVIVDGYNVSKLKWPELALEEQRSRLLDILEDVSRRFGSEITVVFDGAKVVGAHTARRTTIRVVYSPPGVIADDVIRAEVERVPVNRPVVVVTNDAEVVRDVKSVGANIIASGLLLDVV